MASEVEVWKDIPRFEGYYQASNMGRVKSLVRKGRKSEVILKGSPNNIGYMLVQLRNEDIKRKSLLVHRVIMMTFEPRDDADEMEVNHKDLNILNNALSNLEWTTCTENKAHYHKSEKFKEAIKKTPQGNTHHLAVMTDEKVLEFRRRWEEVKDLYGQRSKLAREFGISESTARLITDGITWKHLL